MSDDSPENSVDDMLVGPPIKEFTLTHVVENLSALTTQRQYAPTVEHFNVPWSLSYERNDTTFYFHLYCHKMRNIGNWSVDTHFDMKITSPNGKHVIRDYNFTFGSNAEFVGYGFRQGIPWTQLLSDYAVHDRIILDANVTINEMVGVERKANLMDFSERRRADVVLMIGEERFHVSRIHLSRISPYFDSLLYGAFKEHKKQRVVLKEVDPEMFQYFLELIHLEPTLTDSNVEGVLVIADMYNTKNAVRMCEEFLIYKSKNSWRNKIRIAQTFELTNLERHCLHNMRNTADIRSVMGPDLNGHIRGALLEKALTF